MFGRFVAACFGGFADLVVWRRVVDRILPFWTAFRLDMDQNQARERLCDTHRHDQRGDSDDLHDAFEVVGQHVQGHFGADPCKRDMARKPLLLLRSVRVLPSVLRVVRGLRAGRSSQTSSLKLACGPLACQDGLERFITLVIGRPNHASRGFSV